MQKRKISLIDYGIGGAEEIKSALASRFAAEDFETLGDSVEGAELAVVIGGDGTLLRTLARFDFPDIPFVGINTGHLGFFQELDAADADAFVFNYMQGDFTEQKYRTVEAEIEHDGGITRIHGLNEIVVRGEGSSLCHLDIYIGDRLIEKFSGDGIVVSTPAGSTAYNYSLGGSIIDPSLDLLQLTPMAPVNSTAYRSFTSGIVLPPGLPIEIYPDAESSTGVFVSVDGVETHASAIRRVGISLSDRKVTLLRFKNYEFWNTVKKKLLMP
ncbi:MAG: NAD(+)/NADH kinase [Clostridiales Family XIII bacterium]|jgi:NAD+ kinase|nr:NAD(+)/NADH kinase [Clostridiales Family XIII bacterium]